MSKRRGLLYVVLCWCVVHAAPADVFDYVKAPDASYRWSVGQSGVPGVTNLNLVSQTWQGLDWKHTVTILQPKNPKHPDVAILFITGGSYSVQRELLLGRALAAKIGVTFCVLWDIPNQPLWGMREDDLIAHTFTKAIDTKDWTWPLLFPMAKSAVRAMDALQDWSAKNGTKFTRFVAAGASKRGWTTWFTGAVDPRVVAIMPMVYDNLNLTKQMPHQLALWGAYSPQIDDYTRRGLQAKLESETGRELAAMVDPYTYRERIKMPKLLFCGTNDAYWTIDALNLYRDELVGETWQIFVPNSGHGLNDYARVLSAASGFVRLIGANTPRPEFTWQHAAEGGRVSLTITAPAAKKADLWLAESADGRFTTAKWTSQPMTQQGGVWTGQVPAPKSGYLAVFGEAGFEVAGEPYPSSTTVNLVKAAK